MDRWWFIVLNSDLYRVYCSEHLCLETLNCLYLFYCSTSSFATRYKYLKPILYNMFIAVNPRWYWDIDQYRNVPSHRRKWYADWYGIKNIGWYCGIARQFWVDGYSKQTSVATWNSSPHFPSVSISVYVLLVQDFSRSRTTLQIVLSADTFIHSYKYLFSCHNLCHWWILSARCAILIAQVPQRCYFLPKLLTYFAMQWVQC